MEAVYSYDNRLFMYNLYISRLSLQSTPNLARALINLC